MTSPDPADLPVTGLTRRHALAGAALVGLGGSLAACGEGGEPTGTGYGAPDRTEPTDEPSPQSPSPAEQSPSPAEGPEPATGEPAGGLVAAAEVPVGGGVVLADQRLVVTQPRRGEFKAFSAVCTHRGCTVDSVTDTINCPCHGSRYAVTDGAVVGGPAPSPLPSEPVRVRGGRVVRG